MDSSSPAWKALHEAFPCTIPIFAGFRFLAFAYGFYMYTLEFSFIYPTLMAMIIFGGSLEFVTVSMLLSPFAPWQALVVALTVQARHLFYGLSMLEKYKGTGWKKPFLIFWMCDETFALNYSSTIPYDVDRGWYYFWVSFLNYSYWVSGALLGGLLGTVIQFNAKGLSFVMTSMFLVDFSGAVAEGREALYGSHRSCHFPGSFMPFRPGLLYHSRHGRHDAGAYYF